jgi:hypothetical protein
MAGDYAELKTEIAELRTKFDNVQKKFDDAQKALQETAEKIPRVIDKDYKENRRVRFQDSGDWGRHYSTVRMTVTTFLVGLSLGIISFKWENLKLPPAAMFVGLSTLIWISAVALFIAFTWLTYHEMARARKLDLSDTVVDHRKTLYPRRDPASWVLIIVTLVFGVGLSLVCDGSVLPSRFWRAGTMDEAIYQFVPWAFGLAVLGGIVDRVLAFKVKTKPE